MPRKIFLIFIFIIIAIALFLIITFRFPDKNQETSSNISDTIYKISAIDLPQKIDFAGEAAPLNIYYVQENLDRELIVNTYWHSSTLLSLKRAARWFPVIEPILKNNGIPDDFKYLALIESGLENVTSPAGAKGFWQFLKGTAKDFGLEVNNEVDERYNVEKATRAACKYFNKAHEKYKNWTLVAAAFNAGNKGIDRQIEKQKVNNYYSLLLDDETERYVFRILAIKAIFENPEKYNFYLEKDDLYLPIPTKTIEVKSSIKNLADFAIENGINYRILKEFNPWLRNGELKNKKHKTYEIKIPIFE
ncbi:MAG: lytic transglycosylase domain-containing protein [Bacteroidales bacterium]|nr:lytic transglycosylase domain-containing protein [Bacteroidales bacterium]